MSRLDLLIFLGWLCEMRVETKVETDLNNLYDELAYQKFCKGQE